MEKTLTEKIIKEEFKKATSEFGASTKLGLTAQQLADFKRRPSIKNHLYVLYLAGKLKLTE